MTEKKEGIKKENPPDKERERKLGKQKRTILFCCGGLFLFFLIFAAIFFIRIFFVSGDTNIPLPIPSPSPSIVLTPTNKNIDNSSSSFPIPPNCQDVGDLDSKPFEISSSNPGFFQNIDLHNFKIYGYTYEDLAEQINLCGPKTDGESFWGHASYNIGWHYDFDDLGSSCNIKNLAVGIKIDIFLPEWEKPEKFASGLDSLWATQLQDLIDHENVHRDYDLSAGEEIYSSLSLLPNSDTCDQAKELADSTAYRMVDELKLKNENFDQETSHGRY